MAFFYLPLSTQQVYRIAVQDLLFVLQKSRNVNAVKSSNSRHSILDKIFVESRKELYTEIGIERFDIKRYKKGILRTIKHTKYFELF